MTQLLAVAVVENRMPRTLPSILQGSTGMYVSCVGVASALQLLVRKCMDFVKAILLKK